MRPSNLKTRIFLDSGDPNETREVIKFLGFLDGQTTNPSLIAKNPETTGKKFSQKEILEFYKKVVVEVSALIPAGSVSVEVYADPSTSSGDMLEQGRDFFSWIPNAHIKFPTTKEGLKAAEIAVKEGMRVNLTLCFSQEQAAAVYAATRGAKKGQVFVSPFVGRLDDRGENGMQLVENIIKMYRAGDGHVEVLTASVRNLNHLQYAIQLGSDILTALLKVLKEWADSNFPPQAWRAPFSIPPQARGGIKGEVETAKELKPIPYREVSLDNPWQDYDIRHELTDVGIEKFAADWNALIKP